MRVSQIYPEPLSEAHAAALKLLKRGLWPIPLYPPGARLKDKEATGKEPIGKGWGLERPDEDSLRFAYLKRRKAGIGILLGPASGVIDAEIDGPEGEESLRKLLGGEPPPTLGWSSRRGSHRLFRWDARLDALPHVEGVHKRADLPGLELRIGARKKQIQSACPPTVTDGVARHWIGGDEIAPLPDAAILFLTQSATDRNPPESPRPMGCEDAREFVRNYIKDRPRTGLNPYLQAALDGECDALASAPNGDRNNQLNRSAFNLGQLVDAGLPESTIRHQLESIYRRINPDDAGWRDTIGSGLRAGRAEPRKIPDPKPAPGSRAESEPGSALNPNEPLIVWGYEVEEEPIRWLWPNRVPYGFLTLLAGKTGVGKSFVTLALASLVTTGGELPDLEGECVEQGNVLYIGEDSHKHVLKPRLVEMGADPTRYAFMSWAAMAKYQIDDTEMLLAAWEEAKRPRMVVIDPPTNFLGDKDEHKNAQVRGALMMVSIWAMKYDVAVILITHCNKSVGKGLAAIDRVIGSVAWASTTRIAHILVRDPEDRKQNLFLPMKTNIGEMPMGVAYRIVKSETPGRAKVEWLGPIDVDADEMANGEQPSQNRGERAAEFLRDLFRERREWWSYEIKQRQTAAGISKNALASKECQVLPIRKRNITDPNGDIHVIWTAVGEWPGPVDDQSGKRESGKALPETNGTKRLRAFPARKKVRESEGDRESSLLPDNGVMLGKADQPLQDKDLRESFPAFPLSHERERRKARDRSRAERWLTQCLGRVPELPAAKVISLAAGSGFNEAGLREVIFGSEVFLEYEVDGVMYWSYREDFTA